MRLKRVTLIWVAKIACLSSKLDFELKDNPYTVVLTNNRNIILESLT